MNWIVRITERVQARLLPVMGPAQVQRVEGQTVTTEHAQCPLCGTPLARHDIHRVPGRPTRMECPAA